MTEKEKELVGVYKEDHTKLLDMRNSKLKFLPDVVHFLIEEYYKDHFIPPSEKDSDLYLEA